MINWDKPLESNHGAAERSHIEGGMVIVSCSGVTYVVDKESGIPIERFLPRSLTIINKKTNRDKAIEIAGKHDHPNSLFSELCRYTDALIQAGLLKED